MCNNFLLLLTQLMTIFCSLFFFLIFFIIISVSLSSVATNAQLIAVEQSKTHALEQARLEFSKRERKLNAEVVEFNDRITSISAVNIYILIHIDMYIF
jgi:uncharacterized protein YlxW (UPF0749 family)